MKRKTISDIAKLANTSTATVSRVLNNSNYPVSESLRKKVLNSATELKYVPNLAGKQLKTNESNEIGVIIPSISNPYYAKLISGIEYVASRWNKYILLCNTNEDSDLEKKYLEYLCQKQVNGVIISSIGENTDYLEYMKKIGIDIVAFEQDIDLECTKVNFNYYRGGYLAAKHLINNGHNDIGFISAPLNRHSRNKVFSGFMECLKEYNITPNDNFIKIGLDEKKITDTVFEYNNGRKIIASLLDKKAENGLPSAIFCINDMTAIGVMQNLMENNIKVPDDISVMGFDNIDICEMITPSLSTIDQKTFQMGELAAQTLIHIIKEEESIPVSKLLEPYLVQRSSTKILKSAARKSTNYQLEL
ncbi:transcriptional regulator, LacI family [Lentibacillus persicus]|uniref:Transcriptional regulator, LacI family n=1 Tax=Lentibacillus persicus TaxID=640948 RepID=A0A1I1YP48_9BACI|nr:LacI family DNA-binding transcriptional regulator [Lentibacillus persicus]SFE21316.1 transcriptional regulator, LacI family [Lentibacillus persicus]